MSEEHPESPLPPSWVAEDAGSDKSASQTGQGEAGKTETGSKLTAAAEVVLCSGFPTQLALVVILGALGAQPMDEEGSLVLSYVVLLSLLDAVIVLSLVWMLLRAHGERPAPILLGNRPIGAEALLGLVLVPGTLLLVAVTFAAITRLAPDLHNVAENPLESLLISPQSTLLFALVAVIAGGLREEVQRAFVLHRFERHLGGAMTGLVIFSIAFGLGHLVQGRDAAIVTGMLGAAWGGLYLTRRSIVAPVVCHGVFNLTEVVIAYAGS